MADAVKPTGSPAASRPSWDPHEDPRSPWLIFGALLLLGVAFAIFQTPSWAEDKPQDKPLFLVARPTILDPFFEKSVVLMIPIHEEQIVVGLIVNKPTRLPLSTAFPKITALKDRSDVVYMGGPVEMSTPAMVFHAAKIPKQAIPLYDDVYLTFDAKLITKLLEDSKQAGDTRLFMGRAQWAPEQLDGEALQGSWYSLHAEGNVIFDHDSEHLWQRMHDRARPSTNVQFRMPDLWKGRTRLLEIKSLLPDFPLAAPARSD